MLTRRDIITKTGNINGEKLRMNYVNANHLVQLYDVEAVWSPSLVNYSKEVRAFGGG